MVNPRRSRLAVIIVAVVRPPLFLVVWLYNALFGWWLGPWMNRESERSFEKEIQQSVPSLFAEHRGRFVPQETPKDFESVLPQSCPKEYFFDSADGEANSR